MQLNLLSSWRYYHTGLFHHFKQPAEDSRLVWKPFRLTYSLMFWLQVFPYSHVILATGVFTPISSSVFRIQERIQVKQVTRLWEDISKREKLYLAVQHYSVQITSMNHSTTCWAPIPLAPGLEITPLL